MLLFLLCILSTVYGIILIKSSTAIYETNSYVYIQAIAMVIGMVLFFLFSIIDIETIAEKWKFLFVFNVLFIASLFIFGEAGDSGNRAWIRFGSVGIQPAEIVKITFTIILSKQIINAKERRGLSHPVSVTQIVLHFLVIFGLIIVASSDLGSALVYCFIFIVLLYIAGLKFYWFLIGIGAVCVVFPFAWNHFFTESQKARILVPYIPSIDESGVGISWQANQSKAAIATGGFSGTGLFNGPYTQSGSVPQQHTDFVFSVAGEELGFIGCAVIILLLVLIIVRCIYDGIKCNNQLGMLVCFGLAAMLIFQTLENIGMCLGLTPVIGLTLPFFSYGGSSIITMFAAMGIVSGIKRRPTPSRLSIR